MWRGLHSTSTRLTKESAPKSHMSTSSHAFGQTQEQTTSQELELLKTETKDAVQEMRDYLFTHKAEFVEIMECQLVNINRDLDRLAETIGAFSDAAKTEARPKLEALREQTARLARLLDEARSANESAWDEVKAGFKEAWGELEDAFQHARKWVSDKLAP